MHTAQFVAGLHRAVSPFSREIPSSRDVLLEEGVDAAAVSVTETQMAEEDRVDLRDGVDVAVENSNRPGDPLTNTRCGPPAAPAGCKLSESKVVSALAVKIQEPCG